MSLQLINARVEYISPLTESIMQLMLVPEHYVDYHAGQYLNIHALESVMSYSIANAPLGSHRYELNIRATPDTGPLFAHIQKTAQLEISLPFGQCHIQSLEKERPIIFLAGGTGFAPVKAMLEQLFFNRDKRAFELYWGARAKPDLYLEDKLTAWQSHATHFRYMPLLSDGNKDRLLAALLAQHPQGLEDWQIVISGPFEMAYSIRDRLVAEGIASQHIYSDAFSFEEK